MEVQESELPVCAVIQETIYVKSEIINSENDEDIISSENIYIKLGNTEEPNSQEHIDTLKKVPPKENNPSKMKKQSHHNSLLGFGFRNKLPESEETECVGGLGKPVLDALIQFRLPEIRLNILNTCKKKLADEVLSEDERPSKSKQGKQFRKKKSKKQKNDLSASHDDVLSATDIIKCIELVNLTEEERLAEHRAVVGRLETVYVCDGCALGFSCQEDYAAHLKLHTDEYGTFECDVCRLRFDTATSVEKHRLQHFARSRCMLCSAVLADYELAAEHVAREHVGRVRCPICDRGFKRAVCLSKHIAQCRAPKHACGVCGKLCGGTSQLSKHMRSHEPPHQLTVLSCSVCQLELESRCHLQRHLLTHAAKACERECKDPQTLQVHMMTHKKKKKKKKPAKARCPHCDRVCSNRQMLKRHFARMHAEDREKKFECDYCGSRFMTKGEAREHISWTHMGARRAHACSCGRVFRTPARLRAHVASAHMRRPPAKDHHCDVCNKAFPSNSEMNRHKRTHTSIRYPCPECEETFKTRNYVKIHHKLKHMHMTRDEIRRQNREKREQRMREIATAHRKFRVVFSECGAKNVRDKIGCVESDGGISESKDMCIPMFDTFVDVVMENH